MEEVTERVALGRCDPWERPWRKRVSTLPRSRVHRERERETAAAWEAKVGVSGTSNDAACNRGRGSRRRRQAPCRLAGNEPGAQEKRAREEAARRAAKEEEHRAKRAAAVAAKQAVADEEDRRSKAAAAAAQAAYAAQVAKDKEREREGGGGCQGRRAEGGGGGGGGGGQGEGGAEEVQGEGGPEEGLGCCQPCCRHGGATAAAASPAAPAPARRRGGGFLSGPRAAQGHDLRDRRERETAPRKGARARSARPKRGTILAKIFFCGSNKESPNALLVGALGWCVGSNRQRSRGAVCSAQ